MKENYNDNMWIRQVCTILLKTLEINPNLIVFKQCDRGVVSCYIAQVKKIKYNEGLKTWTDLGWT